MVLPILIRLVVLVGVAMTAAFPSIAQATPQVWLAGSLAINSQKVVDPNAMSDFPDMFHPDAPWAEAASKLQVFKTTSQFVIRAPDDLLLKMFADLRRRHIALAVAGLMLSGDGTCG